MISSIVKGRVFHRRFFPEDHRFDYPVCLYCLDLEELEELDETLHGFCHNRLGINSIRDRDYLDGHDGPIRERLLGYLEKEGLASGIERIMLLTSPRFILGVFNPVSFYYCFDAGDKIQSAVAEVNNTFGDRHLYILAPDQENGEEGNRFRAVKTFHVSPFNKMEGEYEFHFGHLARGVDIRITMWVGGRKKFFASLQGSHLPLTRKSQSRIRLRHPLLPHLTMLRILKEAAVLYFRKHLAYVARPAPRDPMTIGIRAPSLLQKVSRLIFLRVMRNIREGHLRIVLPGGKAVSFGDPDSYLRGTIEVLGHEFFSRAVLREDIGLGEAYQLGLFRSPDLAAVISVLVRAFSRQSRPRLLPALASGTAARMVRFRERNSLPGSRKNISRHYDLSNEFFSLFLDQSMTYSCALFDLPGISLEQAQERKIERIMEKAGISAEDHVLEIGSGWGSFAILAARKTGCRVTTITLSREQHDYVNRLVRKLGLEGRITALLDDYRTVPGKFDRIVSIEMLEAVGHRYLGTFFSRCDELLKSGGRVVLQVITIPDQRYEAYRLRLDWIQKHIFPGGHLPSLTSMCRAMTRSSTLTVENVENIGPHYADTLQRWHLNFRGNLDRIRDLGYDEAFLRKWEFYLRCCEAMFRERALNDLQLVLARPFEGS